MVGARAPLARFQEADKGPFRSLGVAFVSNVSHRAVATNVHQRIRDLPGLQAVQQQPREAWSVHPSSQEQSTLQILRASFRHRVDRANRSDDALQTAFNALEEFVAVQPSRVLLLPHGMGDDHQADRVNDAFFQDLFEWLKLRGNRSAGSLNGAPIRTDSVQKTVSALRSELSSLAERRLLVPAHHVNQLRAAKQARFEDGPAGARLSTRPFRARHFRQLAEAGVRWQPAVGIYRTCVVNGACSVRILSADDLRLRRSVFIWGLLHNMYVILLRGGEPGRLTGKPFDRQRGLRFCDFEWLPPAEPTEWYASLLQHIIPIKLGEKGDLGRIPCPVSRTTRDAPAHSLPLDSYDAIVAVWEMHMRDVPPSARAALASSQQPFWCLDGWVPQTHEIKDIIREMVGILDLPAEEFTAVAPRAGGGSDILESMGPGPGRDLIQQMGRWCGEIGDIYARIAASWQLRTSRDMHTAHGIELETLSRRWRQPGRRGMSRISR